MEIYDGISYGGTWYEKSYGDIWYEISYGDIKGI